MTMKRLWLLFLIALSSSHCILSVHYKRPLLSQPTDVVFGLDGDYCVGSKGGVDCNTFKLSTQFGKRVYWIIENEKNTKRKLIAKSIGRNTYLFQLEEPKKNAPMEWSITPVYFANNTLYLYDSKEKHKDRAKAVYERLQSVTDIKAFEKIFYDNMYLYELSAFIKPYSEALKDHQQAKLEDAQAQLQKREAELARREAAIAKKERENRAQSAQHQKQQAVINDLYREMEERKKDREPTEREMAAAIGRSTLFSNVKIKKLGNCRQLGKNDYACRYRVIGVNWGNFWKEDGVWYFKIMN